MSTRVFVLLLLLQHETILRYVDVARNTNLVA